MHYPVKSGQVLYYRKRNSWEVGRITVREVRSNGFSVRLPNGKIVALSFSIIGKRLFTDKNALGTKRESLAEYWTPSGMAGKANYYGDSYDTSEHEEYEKADLAFLLDGYIDGYE